MKIARVAKHLTWGQVLRLCAKLGCKAQLVGGEVWLVRGGYGT